MLRYNHPVRIRARKLKAKRRLWTKSTLKHYKRTQRWPLNLMSHRRRSYLGQIFSGNPYRPIGSLRLERGPHIPEDIVDIIAMLAGEK